MDGWINERMVESWIDGRMLDNEYDDDDDAELCLCVSQCRHMFGDIHKYA